MTMTIREKVQQALNTISCENCKYGKPWIHTFYCMNTKSPTYYIENIKMPFFCNFWEEKK